MSTDLASEWESVRVKVLHSAILGLEAAEQHEPPQGSHDRRVLLTLSPDWIDQALETHEVLADFVQRFVNNHVGISAQETDFLCASVADVKTYLLQNRPASDLSIALYKELFRRELQDLLGLMGSILEKVEWRGKHQYPWRKQRCYDLAELTLGVEEEYSIVDAGTLALRPSVGEFVGHVELRAASLSAEVYTSQLELQTKPCETLADLERALRGGRSMLASRCPTNIRLLSAGTHPAGNWDEQEPTMTPRIDMFLHDMQDVVRQLLICGLHVHVGISDHALSLRVMDAVQQYLPLLLGLSCSSPFWRGRPTGMASYRRTVFSALPRTGLPPSFASFKEYEEYLDLLTRTKSFDSVGSKDPTKIWWDVRIHPEHPTLEFRVCDACTDVAHTVALAGLIQALVGTIARLEYDGLHLQRPPRQVLEENMWRAARWGRHASLIDVQSRSAVSFRFAVLRMLDLLSPTLSTFGTLDLVRQTVLSILDEGNSADRQIRVYRNTHSLTDVAVDLANQFSP